MPAKQSTWTKRRPIPSCHVGVLHAFGPGFLHAPNRILEFRGKPDRRLQVPLRGLQLVCIYGSVRVTAGAVRVVAAAGAGIAYLSSNGSTVSGILQPAIDEWKGRRYRQFQSSADRNWMLEQARRLIGQKIDSVIEAARHEQRHSRVVSTSLMARLKQWKSSASTAADHESLRGIEGIVAKFWFELMSKLLPEPWTFEARRKRPPTDPVNALLSLGYMVVFNRVESACRAWGLDPALGVFHEYRPGRSSLACDLMEPYRTAIVDRLVLSMLRQGRLQPTDFERDERDNAVHLTTDGLKKYLSSLEEVIHTGEPSFQSQFYDRVRTFCSELPEWDGRWPTEEPTGTIWLEETC